VTFWSDSFISELDRDKKLFYIYLLTNERTSQCGIYEITKKQISFDLGYNIDTVSKLFEYFIKIGKIRYNETTKEIAIKNWLKYNGSNSPKVQSCINKEFEKIKDIVLIQYINNIDTQSQQEEEQNTEQEKEKEAFDFKKSLLSLGIEKNIVEDWLKVRKTKKAVNTEIAFNKIKTEIEKLGLTANECIKIAVEKSWSGFNSEWIQDKQIISTNNLSYESERDAILNSKHFIEEKRRQIAELDKKYKR